MSITIRSFLHHYKCNRRFPCQLLDRRCLSACLPACLPTNSVWFMTDNKPIKIKQPLTGFFRFAQEQRPNLVKQNPGAKVTDYSKQLAVLWKELSEEERKNYNSAFAKEFETYKQSLSEEERKTLQRERETKRKRRELLKNKKIKTQLGQPKKPGNGFFLFLKDEMPVRARSRGEANEQIRGISEKWRIMSEDDKKPYIAKGRELMAAYKEDLSAWEKEMVDTGRQELVRVQSRPKKEKKQKKVAKPKKKKKIKAKKSSKAKGKKKTAKKTVKKSMKAKKTVTSSKKGKKVVETDESWMREE